jgi:hypothetical protein
MRPPFSSPILQVQPQSTGGRAPHYYADQAQWGNAMKPEDLLGVIVRTFGLLLLLKTLISALQLIVVFSIASPWDVAVPAGEALLGVIVIWSADSIVRFCYR